MIELGDIFTCRCFCWKLFSYKLSTNFTKIYKKATNTLFPHLSYCQTLSVPPVVDHALQSSSQKDKRPDVTLKKRLKLNF